MEVETVDDDDMSGLTTEGTEYKSIEAMWADKTSSAYLFPVSAKLSHNMHCVDQDSELFDAAKSPSSAPCALATPASGAVERDRDHGVRLFYQQGIQYWAVSAVQYQLWAACVRGPTLSHSLSY